MGNRFLFRPFFPDSVPFRGAFPLAIRFRSRAPRTTRVSPRALFPPLFDLKGPNLDSDRGEPALSMVEGTESEGEGNRLLRRLFTTVGGVG